MSAFFAVSAAEEAVDDETRIIYFCSNINIFIMNRFILYVTVVLMAFSCHRVEPEIKVTEDPENKVTESPEEETYVFHDDFYYSEPGETYNIDKCPEDFFLLVKMSRLDDAIEYLEENDFNIADGPYRWYADPVEELSDCMALRVNGKNGISSVPGVVYSNCMYSVPVAVPPYSTMKGETNTLLIKLSQYAKDDQLDILNECARQHHLHIVKELKRDYYRLACTNQSSGNIVEMANWFVEVAGFEIAYPEFEIEISFN